MSEWVISCARWNCAILCEFYFYFLSLFACMSCGKCTCRYQNGKIYEFQKILSNINEKEKCCKKKSKFFYDIVFDIEYFMWALESFLMMIQLFKSEVSYLLVKMFIFVNTTLMRGSRNCINDNRLLWSDRERKYIFFPLNDSIYRKKSRLGKQKIKNFVFIQFSLFYIITLWSNNQHRMNISFNVNNPNRHWVE
jgi:hypothetical protein